MNKRIDEITDDEVRFIGRGPHLSLPPEQKRPSGKGVAIVSAILVFALGVLALVFWPREVVDDTNLGVFEKSQPELAAEYSQLPYRGFGTDTEDSFTEKVDTSINDVPLSLYIPHNAIPELMVGTPDKKDKDIVMIAQAADIRGDNFKILGAFVLKGDPLAWGLSKKGFCAIIDGIITLGASETTPLFEEATEKNGYFFRQFPLVDNGTLVENMIKNKSVRKALCTKDGEFFVAITGSPESYHDFSQALVDLGVEQAISLVGSSKSFGWYVDFDGEQTLLGEDIHLYENENYLLWRKK